MTGFIGIEYKQEYLENSDERRCGSGIGICLEKAFRDNGYPASRKRRRYPSARVQSTKGTLADLPDFRVPLFPING